MIFYDFKLGKEIEWLELNLLKNNIPISKSKIISMSGIEDETLIDTWIGELERRSTLYVTPLYDINNNIISPLKSWKEIPEYFLCVYYSYFGASDKSNGTKLFELISAYSLKNFLNGEVYVLGFPAGKNLNEYLDEISATCIEERGIPANSDYKDDGVDAIGYKLFSDNRSGNIYVLLQCAAGIHWAKKKTINLSRWTNYIQWFNNNILCSISTVDFVTQKEWSKRVSDYGIILDRLRIYNYLYKEPIDLELRKDTSIWCSDKISNT